MWIWLTLSMILVLGCIVFGIQSFLSSRSLHRSISLEPSYNGAANPIIQPRQRMPAAPKQGTNTLEFKIKSIEDSSLLTAHHLFELRKRVDSMEGRNALLLEQEEEKWQDSGEDWEKMYYEARREKQLLEEDLSTLKTSLQDNIVKIEQLQKDQAELVASKSLADSGSNEIESLKNNIEKMQRRIEGGWQREKELAIDMLQEKSRFAGQEHLQVENSRLQSEVDILTNTLGEIKEHNASLEKKMRGLSELGSYLEISEHEKNGIKKSVEQLLHKL